LRHSSQLLHRAGGRCSEGPMDGTGQYGYRFDNASVTPSCHVAMGPLPMLTYGAWGKEPN
jgi:hypothetical protein